MEFFDENTIKEFWGEYRFLSNFYEHPILYKGIEYPSSEHAYVSAKSDDLKFKIKVSLVETPGKVKRLGSKVTLIKDWDYKKFGIMEEIVRIKFNDPTLSKKLLETGDRPLYEGNSWNDKTWGVDKNTGEGRNALGKILMKIRTEKKFNSIL